jgi:GGDEF domain-containing protein
MAVILPNSDLEQGITELSDFQKELFQATPDMFCTSDISIGLSSRNGRLINSKRILKEAHAALKRAEKDSETNLIGFRPDPGKFRSFLAMQNK